MAQRFNHPFGTANAAPKPAPKAPMDGMVSEEADAGDPHAVREEHGPAHEVHIQHEHEMGVHHVHSMHPDGHEHHSDHESAEEAHEHAKHLAMDGGEGEPEKVEWDEEE